MWKLHKASQVSLNIFLPLTKVSTETRRNLIVALKNALLLQNIDKNSLRTPSKFCCMSYGHTENADINAAKNTLTAGHVVLACGEDALEVSTKQEPLNMGDLVLV